MSDLQAKLGGGLNKLQGSIQQGKQKLQNVQEIMQLKRVIQESATKRAEYIAQLGESVYLKMRKGEIQDEALSSLVSDIAEYDIKMFQAQVAVEQLSEQPSAGYACPSCNGLISEHDKFCGSCGTPVEKVTVKAEVEKTPCPTCEVEIPVTANFCNCCGTKVAG